jgi:hypothetical protein
VSQPPRRPDWHRHARGWESEDSGPRS